MPTALEKCQQQARHLPLKERAMLIKVLIDELDELDEKDLEQLWIKEASRRFQEFKAGNIKARPGGEVFYNARIKLQEIR
ncbi:MAG: addiction module protein [Desulfobacula sp.]|jgi:putative addiction module component (TIGR02574 family)|nr:addiction module protein [Desulfobacula sp.]